MNEHLVGRVKNSLNKQYYTMNDSWLSDCIEYYLNDHENPTQDEIIQFVMNQWVLYDLREINNEKGCLPKNLSGQKSTILTGKYILQMDKLYDISQSKYKQLEKIRNVSVENVEATEHENAEEKFTQAWEPKSKRMLQLFLTDGVQDVLAIEFKPIRFLKDDLFPGYKLMIKGPVTCRKGVILLEETNISEVGGEVDSLLIVNAVENVFARALNLEENPDPYNDNKKQKQSTENSTKPTQIEDDFDMDSEMLDQIDKQIQSQDSKKNKNLQIPVERNGSQLQNSNNADQEWKCSASDRNKKQSSNFESTSSRTLKNNYTNQKKTVDFQDEDDFFLDMVDEKALISKPTPSFNNKTNTNKITTQKSITDNDFPMDDEIYDLTDDHSPFFNKPKSQKQVITKTTGSSSISNQQKNYRNETTKSKTSCQIEQDMDFNYEPSPPQSNKKQMENKAPVSNAQEFPDDDFDFDDFDMKTDDFKDYFNDNKKSQGQSQKSSQASKNSLTTLKNIVKENSPHQDYTNKNRINSSEETKYSNSIEDWNDDTDFGSKLNTLPKSSIQGQKINDTEKQKSEKNSQMSIKSEKQTSIKYEKEISTKSEKQMTIKSEKQTLIKSETEISIKPEKQMTIKSEKQWNTIQNAECTGIKRLASVTSPPTNVPQKVRCLESTPKADRINNRKITDFLSKPELPSEAPPKSMELLSEDAPKPCELIRDVLKQSSTEDEIHTIVRGKVMNVVKLTMIKGENGSYFHLEGIITDHTANLDVVFSSEVLEKIIGYNTQEFSRKRKQAKMNPSIKDQLRDDLSKAQQTLRVMDALMEIKLKKNERAVIIKTLPLSKEQRKRLDKQIKENKI